MRIDFKPYAIVYSDDTDIYDVHFIIIDEEEKKIDLCDQMGMSIGAIHYANCKEVGCLTFDDDERLTGDGEIIIQNGEIHKGADIMRKENIEKMIYESRDIIDKYLNVERIGYSCDLEGTNIEFTLYDYLNKPGNFENDIECIIHEIQPVIPTSFTVSHEYCNDEYWDGENMVESNLSCTLRIKYIGDD